MNVPDEAVTAAVNAMGWGIPAAEDFIRPAIQAAVDVLAPGYAVMTEMQPDRAITLQWDPRGPVLVAPEVVEGWVEAQNTARGQRAAVIELHHRECRRCFNRECTCSTAEWLEPEDRTPDWRCPVCLASFADEETEAWPCATVQALGVTS